MSRSDIATAEQELVETLNTLRQAIVSFIGTLEKLGKQWQHISNANDTDADTVCSTIGSVRSNPDDDVMTAAWLSTSRDSSMNRPTPPSSPPVAPPASAPVQRPPTPPAPPAPAPVRPIPKCHACGAARQNNRCSKPECRFHTLAVSTCRSCQFVLEQGWCINATCDRYRGPLQKCRVYMCRHPTPYVLCHDHFHGNKHCNTCGTKRTPEGFCKMCSPKIACVVDDCPDPVYVRQSGLTIPVCKWHWGTVKVCIPHQKAILEDQPCPQCVSAICSNDA